MLFLLSIPCDFNFLCGRETLYIRNHPLSKDFEILEHQLTATTLGLGHSSEHDKIPRIVYSQLIESSKSFPTRRLQYKSWLSDQSIEKATADASVMLVGAEHRVLATNASSNCAWVEGLDMNFLYPLCTGLL